MLKKIMFIRASNAFILAWCVCMAVSFGADSRADNTAGSAGPSPVAAQLPVVSHATTDACEGWRLGVQAWSFNRYSFYEALEKTGQLGLNWMEAYPGQVIKDNPAQRFDYNMPEAMREQIKAWLAEAGIRLVNYGVVDLDADEQKCRRVFEFAKQMGIETIVSEPPAEAMGLVDKLCQEYKINVAIHNHPKPSRYWNPDTLLEACKGTSKYIGACADTGHWVRSGLDPLECLKKLEGRVISLHFKEIDDGHDVPWGGGKNRATAMLEELGRQKFKGVFSIEYEYNMENSMPQIRRCIEFFNKTASKINPSGWEELFAADLSNAQLKKPDTWTYDQDGVLALNGGGDIWTKEKCGNFILDFGFKLDDKTNSGVFIRAGQLTWLPWVEVQIEDSFGKPISRQICGGIFDVLAPTANAVKPAGQWNRMTIRADGAKVDVILNGVHIIAMNLDNWTEAHKNPDGTANKFDVAYKLLPRTGYIGLQDHGTKVWYRNIKIKKL